MAGKDSDFSFSLSASSRHRVMIDFKVWERTITRERSREPEHEKTEATKAHFLRLIGCTGPHWTDSVEHLLTLEVETISDDDAAREQQGHLGSLQDGLLQALPRCLQDCTGNGSLPQVHALRDGVDNDAALWNKTDAMEPNECCMLLRQM